MRNAAIATTTLALFGLVCGCREPAPQATHVEPAEASPSAGPSPAKLVMEAAGLRLPLPYGWELLADEDPNFALALGPSELTTQTMSCLIELRRQGAGPLSAGSKRAKNSRKHDLRYRQGPVHGRMRSFAGPTADAVRVVHCRGPRGSSEWTALDRSLDRLEPHADASLPAPAKLEPGALVELCTATPTRKTQVCARRDDGAVYCGASEGESLARISGLPPATGLGCDGLYTCARAEETGALWCWEPESEPRELSAIGEVRALAGACVVSEAGELLCRDRTIPTPTLDGFVELLPFAEAEQALTGVTQVLPGTNSEWGCVVAEGELRCWDRVDALALRLDAAPGRAPQVVEALAEPGEVTGLAALGGRVCVARGPRLSCRADGARYELDSCGDRPCTCLLTGLSSFSCEHEAHARIDLRSHGAVPGVRAVDGACALRTDDRVICRGPITGKREEQAELAELVIGKVPGVLHVLSLDDG